MHLNRNFQISSQHRVAKVNVLSPSQDIEKESIISKAFVRAGGQELVQVCLIVLLLFV